MRYYGAACCALFVLNIAVFWPGIFSMDTFKQWEQVTSGEFRNDHPPLMAWWWKLLYENIMHDKGVLLVFHAAVFWSALCLLGAELCKVQPMLAYLLLALWFTPPVMGMMSVLWKDTGMTCTYLLAVALIMRHTLYGETMGIPALVATLALLFYGTAVRHNALFALPPLCFLLAMAIIGKRRLAELLGLAVLIFLLLVGSVQIVNHAITVKRIDTAHQLLLIQLTGMSQRTGDPTLIPTSIMLHHGVTYQEYMKIAHYNHDYTPMYLFLSDVPQEIQETKENFVAMLHKYPLEYLSYRATMFKHVLRWGLPYPYYPFQKITVTKPALKKWAGDYLDGTRGTPWFWPWVYLMIACGLLVAGIRGWCRKRSACLELTLLAASGICYVLPYSLLAPTADFRYSYWLVISAMIRVILLVYSRFRAQMERGVDAASGHGAS